MTTSSPGGSAPAASQTRHYYYSPLAPVRPVERRRGPTASEFHTLRWPPDTPCPVGCRPAGAYFFVRFGDRVAFFGSNQPSGRIGHSIFIVPAGAR